jgi:DNA-binding transcriptional LysR family regulator
MDVEEARLAVSETTGAPSGVLRVTMPASLACRHMIPAVSAFQERHPAVKTAVFVTDGVVDLVEEGFDLAIRLGRLSDSSLVARKIGSAQRIVCASPAYLKKNGAPKTPVDLARRSCITFRTHPGASGWAFKGPNGRSVVRVSGALITNDGPTLVSAAVAGLGLVLVPRWLTGAEIKRQHLQVVLDGYAPDPADTALYAVYPHQRHLPPKVRLFIDFLVERFGQEIEWAGAVS